MGGIVSTSLGKSKVDEHSVLLLGGSHSGKTTLIKSMKIHKGGGLSISELVSFRRVIRENALRSAQHFVFAATQLCIDYDDKENHARVEDILSYRLNDEDDLIDPEIVDAIHTVWTDGASEHFQWKYLCEPFMDSTRYFCHHIRRIGAPGYLPSNTDVLRAQEQNDVKITETLVGTDKMLLRMIEAHPPFERYRWDKWLDTLTTVVFCVNLADYDEVLKVESELAKTKMTQSLKLFEAVVNLPWSHRTSILLLFTKDDLFREKLSRAPLERYYPDYKGGIDFNQAFKFIVRMFMKTKRRLVTVDFSLSRFGDVDMILVSVKDAIVRRQFLQDFQLT